MPIPLAALLALALPLCTHPQQPAPAAAAALTLPELEHMAQEVRVQIEALRGRTFSAPVPVELADGAAFVAYARARGDAFAPPAQRRTQQLAAELLGTLDAGVQLEALELELLRKQVGGFYAPERKRFYLMTGAQRAAARSMLSHELTHALDDQLYDIDAVLKRQPNADAQAAVHAVIEGSAIALMQQWQLAELKAGRLTLAELEAAQSMDGLDTAPELLWKPLVHSYLQGLAFLAQSSTVRADAAARVTAAEVERAFRAPPRSTEQVLHPDKYWVDAQRDEPREVRIAAAALPAGWSATGEDTLGELGLALVATPRATRQRLSVAFLLQPRFTSAAVDGWDGDRVAVYEHAAGAALVLHSVWDTAEDARQFADALGALRGEIEAHLGAAEGAPRGVAVERLGANEVQVRAWRGVDAAPLFDALSVRVEADPLAGAK